MGAVLDVSVEVIFTKPSWEPSGDSVMVTGPCRRFEAPGTRASDSVVVRGYCADGAW